MSTTIPTTPVNQGRITMVYEVPSWMLSVAYSVLTGKGEADAINGISYNTFGDLVLYRKPTDADKRNFNVLNNVEDLWITFDQGLPSD